MDVHQLELLNQTTFVLEEQIQESWHQAPDNEGIISYEGWWVGIWDVYEVWSMEDRGYGGIFSEQQRFDSKQKECELYSITHSVDVYMLWHQEGKCS